MPVRSRKAKQAVGSRDGRTMLAGRRALVPRSAEPEKLHLVHPLHVERRRARHRIECDVHATWKLFKGL